MLRQSAIFAVVILASSQAYAVCTQKDLKGSWRFEFNTGALRNDNDRLRTMSCILQIKGNGAIVPGICTPVDASGDGGEFQNIGNRKFRMASKNCEVKLSGNSPQLALRWLPSGSGATSYLFTNARLSISQDKQVISGWLSSAATPHINVKAIKRAKP